MSDCKQEKDVNVNKSIVYEPLEASVSVSLNSLAGHGVIVIESVEL